MKMRNIVRRVVVEPTSLALWASLLIKTPPRLADATTVTTPTSLCEFLSERIEQASTLVLLEL